jgi:hypothetical protein
MLLNFSIIIDNVLINIEEFFDKNLYINNKIMIENNDIEYYFNDLKKSLNTKLEFIFSNYENLYLVLRCLVYNFILNIKKKYKNNIYEINKTQNLGILSIQNKKFQNEMKILLKLISAM